MTDDIFSMEKDVSLIVHFLHSVSPVVGFFFGFPTEQPIDTGLEIGNRI